MKFGLNIKQQELLISIFKKYAIIDEVIVYGSRAKGNFSDRSDIDLVIKGKEINRHQIGEIIFEINETDFPFQVDLQGFNEINNEKLIDHINRVGKLFYKNNNT